MDAVYTHPVRDWPWASGQPAQDDIARLPAPGIEAVFDLALPTSCNAPAEAERGGRA